jgi:serine/threonine-protein kinase
MNYPVLASAPMSIGRFRVEGTLGSGPSHVMYQAVDTRTGAQVALKCGLPGMAHRDLEPLLKREWGAAQRLTHPGIQRVLEMAQEDTVGTFLVLESLEGMSLASLIVRGIPAFQGLHLLVQLLHVLEAAERDGLLHGDLRPENLWIGPTGTLRVLGFGSADCWEEDARPGPLRDSAHLAPERLQGAPAAPSSELFTFALTAFQVLTGHLPYGRSGNGSSDMAAADGVLHFPVDMPKAMQSVFSKALDRLPENRYANLHGFISVLVAASPLDEDRLEALLAFIDGAAIPIDPIDSIDVTGLLCATSAAPHISVARNAEPAAVPVPAVSPVALPPESHPGEHSQIEGLLSGLAGVQEFAIYSQGDVLEATSHAYRTLASMIPSFYFQVADSLHSPENETQVRTITIKSQRQGTIVLFRSDPFSIVLLLKPGKTAKGILEEFQALRST